MQAANVPFSITPEQRKQLLSNAKICYMCKESLKEKVIDHDHFNGHILGVNCVNCNLKRRARLDVKYYRFFIPILFHNSMHYDAHLLISKLGNYKVTAIPKNSENFLFLDSLNFLPSSLSVLVETLKKGSLDLQSTFKLMHNEFSDEHKFNLLLQKGEYPYSYMDSFSKFD